MSSAVRKADQEAVERWHRTDADIHRRRRKNAAFRVTFPLYDADGASSSPALTVTDIEISKDGGTTQRSSDAGYTLLDTDGIDFDSITGIHGFKIDLSDNTDAGFYAAAHDYFVVVSAVTVDSQTVNFVACSFSIENRSITANVTKWLGTAAATPTTAGVPEVDVTHWNGTAVASPATAGYPAVTLKVGTGTGEVNLASGKAPATIAAGDIANSAITAASIAADAITDAKVASDVRRDQRRGGRGRCDDRVTVQRRRQRHGSVGTSSAPSDR